MIRQTVFLVFIFGISIDAFSQFGSVQPGPAPAPQVVQLPLSGLSPQGGAVTATQSPIPGTTTSVNTINPSIEVQGPYKGSVPGTPAAFNGKLTLGDAMDRGFASNLGPVGLNNLLREATAQAKMVRSTLLPNITGNVTEAVQQENLRAFGLRFTVPFVGISLPTIVGPFNYIDFRARLTQNIIDMTALNNDRSARLTIRAGQFAVEDARDLTALAVGGAYLQVIAAAARVEAAKAQLETANALYKQTAEQRAVGLVAQIDVNRSQVQALTEQQRLVSLQNDLSKQKINLARLTGLPPNDAYEITSDIPFSLLAPLSVEDALKEAMEKRADLKSAFAQVEAAERTRAAARAERLPSLSLSGDYGAIGVNPAQSHGTFSVIGTLRIPIWEGGRTEGDIQEAEAALAQRKSELADLRGRIESDVRNAFLDMQAAQSQVDVAQKNLEVNQETLTLTRQKLDAGISDTVAVVQSQDAVASAELDYINSVFAHNIAKLSLARAIGPVADTWPQFLTVK